MDTERRVIKRIRINANKCSGCRMCESMCSAFHNDSVVNTRKSRIRVFRDDETNLFVPVIAGPYTEAECVNRTVTMINGKEYGECSFCRAACKSRDIFIEPDTGLPLKCDLCEDVPPLKEPTCVTWCISKALTYEEKEIEVSTQWKQ